MIKGNSIKHYFYYALESYYKLKGQQRFYMHPKGLKVWNCAIKTLTYQKYKVSNTGNIGSSYYLCIDGLKDSLSLYDVEIRNSPHFDLVERLEQNQLIENSDYIKRLHSASLDFRNHISYKNSFFEQQFKIRKKQILNNEISPIILYQNDDKYYVLDGKHRLSLCLLLNQSCPAWIIQNPFENCFYNGIYHELNRLDFNNFEKHKSFFKLIGHT